ncbi:MAG: phosphoglycerate dehydrogenase, partial [Eubacteriales bacterium]|nr:phosphoglycerate dehydrogenase [Eubacteriales bacterium]
MKVLVTDSVSQSAVDVLKREPDIEVEVRNKMTPEEFLEIIPQFDALIVRSATKVTREVMDV